MKQCSALNGRKKSSRKSIIILILFLIGLAGIGYIYAVFHGIFLLNNPSAARYPVRGVDVSHYQGTIDWKVLESQGIDFAYIKATEGSSHTDKNFKKNWQSAFDTAILTGAYHFFSFDSQGDTQLLHFTNTVPVSERMLPPVVDFEFYADKKNNPPDADTVTAQLTIMLKGLEEYYHMKPIIYATEDSFNMYLKGRFTDYPLWIRNVITKPDPAVGDWLFWQYTNREKLSGYSGEEAFIDMNVFHGSCEEWERWVNQQLPAQSK